MFSGKAVGSAWMTLCWCRSNLISQTADRRLNWVTASRMPSHSLMESLRVLSWVPCFYSLLHPPGPYNFQFQCYPSSLCWWHPNILSTWLQKLWFRYGWAYWVNLTVHLALSRNLLPCMLILIDWKSEVISSYKILIGKRLLKINSYQLNHIL